MPKHYKKMKKGSKKYYEALAEHLLSLLNFYKFKRKKKRAGMFPPGYEDFEFFDDDNGDDDNGDDGNGDDGNGNGDDDGGGSNYGYGSGGGQYDQDLAFPEALSQHWENMHKMRSGEAPAHPSPYAPGYRPKEESGATSMGTDPNMWYDEKGNFIGGYGPGMEGGEDMPMDTMGRAAIEAMLEKLKKRWRDRLIARRKRPLSLPQQGYVGQTIEPEGDPEVG